MKKKNIKLIIFAEAILFLVIFALYVCMSGGSSIVSFIDPPSLLGILILTILGLLIMGQGRNFLKAFSVGNKHYSLMELKNIVEAVSACQKLVLYGGLLELTIGMVIVGYTVTETTLLPPYISVVVLAGVYTIFFEFLLLPLHMNAVTCMNEEMDVDYES